MARWRALFLHLPALFPQAHVDEWLNAQGSVSADGPEVPCDLFVCSGGRRRDLHSQRNVEVTCTVSGNPSFFSCHGRGSLAERPRASA